MRHIVARRTAALCRSAHVARASAIRRLTSLCLAHSVAHAARIVGAVREADDVDARWDVQRVVRVEVAAEHALVTAARTRQHVARQGAAARAVVSVSVCRFRALGLQGFRVLGLQGLGCLVESLESDDHAVGLRAVREPMRDCGLEEHVLHTAQPSPTAARARSPLTGGTCKDPTAHTPSPPAPLRTGRPIDLREYSS
jgi:hypothetical protein